MDTAVQFTIQGTRFPELKRVCIGPQVLLVSKQGVWFRKELICYQPFKRVPLENGVAPHLHFKHSYLFKGKLLEVEAISRTTYGPLGDRLLLNVWYDGKQIGDFSALKSYMGGGVRGDWPIIRDEEGVLFFKFSTNGIYGNESEFLIEYYDTIVDDPIDLLSTPIYRSFAKVNVPEGLLDYEYSLDELEKFKQIEWQIPIRDELNNKIGTLSSCCFKGIDQYFISSWGKGVRLTDMPRAKTVFAKSVDEQNIYSIVFQDLNGLNYNFPWGSRSVRM